jgi:hypothetical protein
MRNFRQQLPEIGRVDGVGGSEDDWRKIASQKTAAAVLVA